MFKLLEEECHALDMIAAKDSSNQVFSQASSSFREYRSKVQELSNLESSREDAKAQAEKIDQVYTSASLVLNNSEQLEVLKNGALYYRRLMTELVRS